MLNFHDLHTALGRIPASVLFQTALRFGVALTLAGVSVALLLRGPSTLQAWYPLKRSFVLSEIGFGLGLGIVAGVAVWVLTERVKPLGDLRERLAMLLALDQLGWGYALALGIAAGLPEEIFFRGALQPTLGLVLTALLFGLLHAISPIYMVFASLAGFLLGGLAQARGDLWAATCAHMSYDAYLLWRLGRWERRLARQIQEIDR